MNSTQPQLLGFAYAIGEEVVARLDDADVFSLDDEAPLPEAARPNWTIGSVMACFVRDGQPSYLLRFRTCCAAYVSVVSERAIDGIA